MNSQHQPVSPSAGGAPVTTTFGTRPQAVPVQQPSPMPFGRYHPFVPVDVPDRTWPAKRIDHAPRWLTRICVMATRP